MDAPVAMDLDHLGDRWYIVVIVYFFVFLPWTVIQAIDYISDEWKTVEDTRIDGWRQFFFTLVPIGVISAYIVFQIRATDFKEMSAAIVALLFALQHLCHTWWGLWQLREFHGWAIQAIKILESQGVSYELQFDDNELESTDMTPESKAEKIKVNNSVVDNQIFRGAAKCYVVRTKHEADDSKMMYRGSRTSRKWYTSLTLIFQIVLIIVFSLFAHLWSELRKLLPFVSDGNGLLPWRHRPYQPVDLWIRWAVPFTAQGLNEWMIEFDTALDPGPASGESSLGYDGRQNYFAREVLASALMLLPERDKVGSSRGTKYGEGHPLQWKVSMHHTAESEKAETSSSLSSSTRTSFDATGKVSKMELLQHALASGKGLPFDAAHTEFDKEGSRTDAVQRGYKDYAYELKQSVGSMPAKFGNTIDDKFDVDKLEWLTIMLNLGFNRICTTDADDGSSTNMDLSGSTESTGYNSEESLEEKDVTNEDVSIEVLRTQLGVAGRFGRFIEPITRTGSQALRFTKLAFPLQQQSRLSMYHHNRNALAVSGMIDVWKALISGDCVRNVLKHDADWEDACLVHGSRNHDATSLISAHSALERMSLAGQFGMCNLLSGFDLHLDHTISFMGIALEEVRSALARGLKECRGSARSIRWKAPITFSSPDNRATHELLHFEASESLACCLSARHPDDSSGRGASGGADTENGAEGAAGGAEAHVNGRPVQMRLLWELQNECIRQVGTAASPEDCKAMMACILGFPALQFKDADTASQPWSRLPVQQNGNEISVAMDRVELSMCKSIVPMCGPQKLSIEVGIWHEGEQVLIGARLARASEQEDDQFDWQAWRDAFGGRVEGMRNWQESQGLVAPQACVTSFDILQPIEPRRTEDLRTGPKFDTWLGWLPARQRICRFELESAYLLRNEDIQRGFDSYIKATRASLTYASTVVCERLCQIADNCADASSTAPLSGDGVENTKKKSPEELVHEGEQLLEGGSHNTAMAVVKFETAARVGSVEGLKRAVEILTDDKSGTTDLMRALNAIEAAEGYFSHSLFTSTHTQRQREIEAVEESFQNLLDYPLLHSRILIAFSKFEVNVGFGGRKTRLDVINTLRRYFRQSGDVRILEEMCKVSITCAVTKGNPLGSLEGLPVGTWGSWLISTVHQRIGSIHTPRFPLKNYSYRRNDLDYFSYLDAAVVAALKSATDWNSLEEYILNISAVEDNFPMFSSSTFVSLLAKNVRCEDDGSRLRRGRVLDILRAAAEVKNYHAAEALGDIYDFGLGGVDADVREAVEMFGKGAALYSCVSKLVEILGREDVEAQRMRDRIVEILHAAVEEENYYAAEALGDIYDGGLGEVDVDVREAVEMFGKGAAVYSCVSKLVNIVRREDVEARRMRDRVIEILRIAVEEENYYAAEALGNIYHGGLGGVDVDMREAVEMFGKGTTLSDDDQSCVSKLVEILGRECVETQRMRDRIVEILRAAVEKDNYFAAEALGDIYNNGLGGVDVDVREAVEMFGKGTTLNDDDQSCVSKLVEILGREDVEAQRMGDRIVEILHIAVEEDNFYAAEALGDIYDCGLGGVVADVREAVEMFGKGITLNDDDESCVSKLVNIVSREDVEAKRMRDRIVEIFHAAVEEENYYAAEALGNIYRDGLGGVEVDLKEAVEMFGKGATLNEDDESCVSKLVEILGREGVEAQRMRDRIVEILHAAVEENYYAAEVLDEIYSGNEGI